MQKSQLLQLQADLTRKKELNNFLIYTLKSGTMSLNEKTAIKKAVDCFNVSISQLERSINIELKRRSDKMTTYKIDYCNGFFLTVEAEDLKEATQKAMESAAYTQCDIKIRDEDYNTIATSKWYGVPPEDWDKPLLIIGGGFYDAFQDIEYSEYI